MAYNIGAHHCCNGTHGSYGAEWWQHHLATRPTPECLLSDLSTLLRTVYKLFIGINGSMKGFLTMVLYSKKVYLLVSAFALNVVLGFLPTSAMENEDPTHLFKTQGRIQLSIEETIPLNCQSRGEALQILKNRVIVSVTQPRDQNIQDERLVAATRLFGNTIPSTAPWCLLTAKYIQSLGARPDVGDWGCGHGFFSQHAVLAGANPWAIDFTKEAAENANRNIWAFRKYLPQNLDMKKLYKVSHTSAANPIENFMKRKNDINVAFNLIHYLTPDDADQFFTNLFLNTKDNGIVILCTDTPFDPDFLGTETTAFYKEGVEKGLKYPGFGVCSVSQVMFSNSQPPYLIKHRSYRPSKQELDEKKFQIGYNYKGIYPKFNEIDEKNNGGILSLREAAPYDARLKTVLEREPTAYGFGTNHALYNLFDFPELKKVMEEAGFSVINGWYTDRNLDTLYPLNDAPTDLTLRGKVILVGQKIVP